MTIVRINSNCCKLSLHSFSASDSSKSLSVKESESVSELGRESNSSSSPFEGGSIREGCDVDGSDMKEASVSDMVDQMGGGLPRLDD